MKVSVVIPVYNGERFIGKAIESALKQSAPVHEIIVIDDGSTDGTPEILNGFGDKIITKRIQNSGASNARNVGMAMATGEAIAFLDADDAWFKDKIKKQIEAADQHPEAGFFCCNYIVRAYSDGKNTLRRHYSKLDHISEVNFDGPLRAHPFVLLLKENIIGTPSAVMVRKELVDRVGIFSDDHRPAEDYDYWLRCATNAKFIVLNDSLFYKRTHDHNLSNDTIRTGRAHQKVLRDTAINLRDYIVKNGFTDVMRQAIADWDFHLGTVCFESSKKKEAFALYRKAFMARKSFSNALFFLMVTFKKGLRVLTFDVLSRRELKKVGLLRDWNAKP